MYSVFFLDHDIILSKHAKCVGTFVFPFLFYNWWYHTAAQGKPKREKMWLDTDVFLSASSFPFLCAKRVVQKSPQSSIINSSFFYFFLFCGDCCAF